MARRGRLWNVGRDKLREVAEELGAELGLISLG